MDQEPQAPQEEPSGAGDGKPKLFQSVNSVIAGITALVIALGGLAAATKGIWGDKEPAQQAAADATAQPAAEPGAADQAAASSSEPEADAPTVYTGDGIRLEWAGEQWVLTGTDGTFYYDDTYSSDENRYLGYDKTNRTYLRWPIEGGMAEEGSEDRETWTRYVELYPE